jgi:hypothetical protein
VSINDTIKFTPIPLLPKNIDAVTNLPKIMERKLLLTKSSNEKPLNLSLKNINNVILSIY